MCLSSPRCGYFPAIPSIIENLLQKRRTDPFKVDSIILADVQTFPKNTVLAWENQEIMPVKFYFWNIYNTLT